MSSGNISPMRSAPDGDSYRIVAPGQAGVRYPHKDKRGFTLSAGCRPSFELAYNRCPRTVSCAG